MTTSPIGLTSPQELLAVIPFMLGFHPKNQDSGHSALVLVRSGLDFDLVAQDEIGAGVPGVGRGEVLAQLGDGGGGALGW